ncbi:Murein hydrolase activator NlpD [Candidatus Erwinia haradaeae]|uniref:Murein hydrolase activator NlpD n=1 Tax=Candidatus Erwinia haradaeae TaxID=1922217 RepID=A0A451D9D1_9GAMM|nr:Murein hydrolase activator NlpD [Candidatus Erwinia haradaeae]
MKRHHITTYVLAVLALAGCSNNYNTPAPISTAKNDVPKIAKNHYNTTKGANNAHRNRVLHHSSTHTVHRALKSVRKNYRKNLIQNNNQLTCTHRYDPALQNSYTQQTYIVHPGDTLFYIAWLTGNNIYDLMQRNHIHRSSNLSVGQKLKLSHKNHLDFAVKHTITVAKIRNSKNLTTLSSSMKPTLKYINTFNIKNKKTKENTPNVAKIAFTHHDTIIHLATPKTKKTKFKNQPIAQTMSNHTSLADNWHWPSDGKIINFFSSGEGGNKGIDIAGTDGNLVVAAAYGRVVYTGHALRGYGNLIIIKHNNNYLSAYAHNAYVYVHNQQIVCLGQKIATMGKSGTNSVRLHFEIRYKGKSVNPLLYLPQR